MGTKIITIMTKYGNLIQRLKQNLGGKHYAKQNINLKHFSNIISFILL